jgi:dihydrodiol dehydrogenase / D-xylose 1-dehydrogenase (NADP)
MEKKQFNWAVLGPGVIAHKVVSSFSGAPGAALYAVGSRNIARAKAFAQEFGAAAAYGSYEEVANDPKVDAVYVATPHSLHCENAILCLEHGKPVLCEKPFSINAGFARRMADAARANGVFLMEAMWTRFLPAIAKVRELLASGAIGEPRMLAADCSFSMPPNPASRLYNPALGGGGLLDVGVYTVSLSSMVFGRTPAQVASLAHIGATGVDEHAALLLKYPGGQIAALTCGIHACGYGGAEIMGTEGAIELKSFNGAKSVHITRGGVSEELKFPVAATGYEYQIIETMDCVRKGLTESPTMPLDETIAVMETMDRVRAQWGLEYPMEKEV